jgi:cyclopropane fatty-acyl-phospholipid synthase-like methyltransferase
MREPFEDLTFMTPLSDQRADRLVRFLAEDLHGTVVDIGCGWAELLLRVVSAAPAAHGIGVDIDEGMIDHGRVLADRRGLSDRVTLLAGDGKAYGQHQANAVICIGASHVWGPPVEENLPLDYASALRAIREMVERGARVVFGEGVWSRPPTPEAAAPLSGRLDELVELKELIELAVAHRFTPIAVHEASLEEWDDFESGYSARYAKWLAEHDRDDPDAAEVLERAARQRAGYFGGYRGILGMAYLSLVAV